LKRAVHIALKGILHELETNLDLDRVIVVCFDQTTLEEYRSADKELFGNK
jgi:hypothetical protein